MGNSVEFKQLINLKLLNYFSFENNFKSIFDINHTFSYSFIDVLKKTLKAAVFLNLPNKVFFESSNIFLNNSGTYKKSVKIIPTLNKSKENWHIIRKLVSSLSQFKLSNKIVYSIKNLNNFIKFIGLQFYPISYFT